MNFIDLHAQQERIREKIERNIFSVLDSGSYIMGPEVKLLESTLSEYVGEGVYGIGCSSGTDALLLALMAIGAGPGDAVYTTPFTFIATAEVISLLGATPVFVDIDPKNYNISPDALEEAIKTGMNKNGSSLKPKAIISVDLFGLPADYENISQIADQYELVLVEDAAQSFGAEYKGRKACSFGNVACTSFFPAKPLGGYGDGGMCFTKNEKIADIIRSLLVHGKGTHKYENVRIGINGRLDTIQAAILLAKFEIFDEELKLRQAVANKYCQGLSALSAVETPQVPKQCLSAWAQYSIMVEDSLIRRNLQAVLKQRNIPTAIYYPTPLHLQPAFNDLGYAKGAFVNSEAASERIFSLPMHPYLKDEEQNAIIETIKDFFQK